MAMINPSSIEGFFICTKFLLETKPVISNESHPQFDLKSLTILHRWIIMRMSPLDGV